MKKTIKTLLALAAVSVLTACGAPKEEYKGTKIDFFTFRGYADELEKRTMDLYPGLNLSGTYTYTFNEYCEEERDSKEKNTFTYEFDYTNKMFHIKSDYSFKVDYPGDPTSSIDEKLINDYYLVIDNKEGLIKYTSHDICKEGVDPVLTKENILSVSTALSDGLTDGYSIDEEFNWCVYTEINNILDYNSGDRNAYSSMFLNEVLSCNLPFELAGSEDTIQKEDFYVDFENDSFIVDIDAYSEYYTDNIGCYSGKTTTKKYVNYKNGILGKATCEYADKFVFNVSEEKKLAGDYLNSYSVENTLGATVTLPDFSDYKIIL